MNTLVLDTSSEYRILCLKTPDGVFDGSLHTGFVHSSDLLEAVDGLLSKGGTTIHGLSLLGCGIGPGSFTGVRIAVTTARMISQLTGVPLAGLRSHLLYALHPKFNEGDTLLAAYDAKKKRVFGAVYRITDDIFRPESVKEEGDYPISDLLAHCNEGKVYGVGSGCALYADEIISTVPEYEFLSGFLPDPETVCSYTELAAAHSHTAKFTGLVPYYARLSDAEALKKLNR